VLPAVSQGRRRGVGMPRLLSAPHPRGASQYVTGPRPEAARVPADTVDHPAAGLVACVAPERVFCGAARLGLACNRAPSTAGITLPGTGCRMPGKERCAHRVQLRKDVLRLVNGTGWPAAGSRRPGQFTPGAVMRAGRDSGLRLALALTGHHRDRRGSGAGRLRWLRSPGRGPERNRGHRSENDGGQRNVRRHQVLQGAPPRLPAAIAADLPCFLGRCAPALTTP
jgi:hypothetical protein